MVLDPETSLTLASGSFAKFGDNTPPRTLEWICVRLKCVAGGPGGRSRRGVSGASSLLAHRPGGNHPPAFRCRRTVAKPLLLTRLEIALSEKQIPQVVENNESRTDGMEPLERAFVRPRQVRYLAALRPTRPQS